jgi:hypothetical protein
VKNVLSVKKINMLFVFDPTCPSNMYRVGFFTERCVLWFLGFYYKPLFHLLLWPLTEIYVISDFIQYFLEYKHMKQFLLYIYIHIYFFLKQATAAPVLRTPPTSSSPLLEVPSMFHTRGPICQLCLKWYLSDPYWQFCKLSPHFCLWPEEG